jgi:hypothetical protein
MIVFILWWYLYTFDNGVEMKNNENISWWFYLMMIILVIVMKCESCVFDLVISLMMNFLSILLRRWLRLIEMIMWEYMEMLYVCDEHAFLKLKKVMIYYMAKCNGIMHYMLICLIEIVIYVDEFCYVKIWFDVYTR